MNLIWSQGRRLLFIVLILFYFGYIKTALALFTITFVFFRAPHRTIHVKDDNVLRSPADGTILKVDTSSPNFNHVVIYLSLTDVHVQYAPCDGVIVARDYHHGTFSPAFWREKSDLNERVDTLLQCKFGKIILRQFAGTIARTIVSFVNVGDHFTACQQLGMIKLGSRVDILVPKTLDPVVKEGQSVTACLTTLFVESFS